jgi:integrase
MAVRERGDSWQVDFMVRGERFRFTFDEKDEAEAWELQARANIKRGLALPPVKKVDEAATKAQGSLKNVFAHLEETRWKAQPRSYKQTMVDVRKVLRFFGEATHVRELTEARIAEFIKSEQNREVSPSTINHSLAVITPALKYAASVGLIQGVPRVKNLKPGGPRFRIVSYDEQAAIVSFFNRLAEPDMADLTILGIETGCRLSELLGLEWDMVADDLSRLWVERAFTRRTLYDTTKSSAGKRRIPLSPDARNALVRLKQRHPDEPGPLTFMRRNFECRWRDLWDRMRNELGMLDVVIHSLRHTCATRLCERVTDREDLKLSEVKKWMGHSTIEQTQAYVHHDDAALDRLMENREAGKPKLRQVG